MASNQKNIEKWWDDTTLIRCFMAKVKGFHSPDYFVLYKSQSWKTRTGVPFPALKKLWCYERPMGKANGKDLGAVLRAERTPCQQVARKRRPHSSGCKKRKKNKWLLLMPRYAWDQFFPIKHPGKNIVWPTFYSLMGPWAENPTKPRLDLGSQKLWENKYAFV